MGILDVIGKLMSNQHTGKKQSFSSAPIKTSPKTGSRQKSSAITDKEYDSFEAKLDKIVDMEDDTLENPDQVIKTYDRMLEKFDELKKWVFEKYGNNGDLISSIDIEIEDCKKHREEYLKTEYEDVKFAYKNAKTIENKLDKINDMNEDFLDPDKTVRNYEEMISKFDALKRWCEERNGIKYFNEEVLPDYEALKKEAQDFKDKEYELKKQKYEVIKHVQNQIMETMKDAPVKKTELEKLLAGDENYKTALKDLIENGSIIQSKDGNRIIYSTVGHK